jgi:hypothetical protein
MIGIQCPEPKGGEKVTDMTKEAASRIQSHADRTGQNKGFASRAQSASERKGK